MLFGSELIFVHRYPAFYIKTDLDPVSDRRASRIRISITVKGVMLKRNAGRRGMIFYINLFSNGLFKPKTETYI